MKAKYQTFRRNFDAIAKKIPFIGERFFNLIVRLKRAVKAVFYIDNFFVDLGFEYVGPIGGHKIQTMIDVFKDVRKLNRPVVIHVITRKGKGYGYAEVDPDSYHGVGSFSVDNGLAALERPDNQSKTKTFTESFSNSILQAAEKDKNIVAITAAMQSGTGLSPFAQAFPKRFFDVGIAEEHAVTFAAGLAARGLKPVVAIYSTFIQRSVDQIIHDTALQKLPVVFALDRAGLVGADGETHQGLFDISIFSSTPNMTILTPASQNEMKLMMDYTLGINCNEVHTEASNLRFVRRGEVDKRNHSGPVIIRYPKAYCPLEIDAFSLPLETGKGVWTEKNNANTCLAFTGSLYKEVREAAAILKQQGIEVDLYNLRFLKPIDENYLTGIMNEYKFVCFIEEGIKQGGFGEYASSLALQRKCKAEIQIIAVESNFFEEDRALGTREELLAVNALNGKGIAEKIKTAAIH